MIDLRDADADDVGFLTEMLAVAADWRPGAQLRAPDEILRTPEPAHYVDGWPRPGDFGVIAQVGHPVRAVWYRLFSFASRCSRAQAKRDFGR